MKRNKTGKEEKKSRRACFGSTVTVGWFESMIRCRPQSQLRLRLPIALIRYIWFWHQPSLLFPHLFLLSPFFGVSWCPCLVREMKRSQEYTWKMLYLHVVAASQNSDKTMKMKNGLACMVSISKEDPTRKFTAEKQQQSKTTENVI